MHLPSSPSSALFGLMALALSVAPPASARAQDAGSAAASGPVRLSSRCTCDDPSDLGLLPLARANAISPSGRVVGLGLMNGTRDGHAAAVAAGGWADDLHQTYPWRSTALDVNEAGEIVGNRWLERNPQGAGKRLPFRFTFDEGYQDLPLPEGLDRASALALDAHGNILVGDSWERAFVWLASERRYVALPGLGGRVEASQMNQAGDVAGVAYDAAGAEHPVVWRASDHALRELPTLAMVDGVRATGWRARALNDRGTVVGSVAVGADRRAVVWTGADHALRVLGTGEPAAVNNQNLVAGGPWQMEHRSELLLWDATSGESMRLRVDTSRLPSGWQRNHMFVALDLNDAGFAVGFNLTGAGDRGFRFPRIVCTEP